MAMAEDMATEDMAMAIEDMARGLLMQLLMLMLMLHLMLMPIPTTEAMAMEDMVDTVGMVDTEAMEVTGATMVDTMASDLLMLVLMPMLTIEAMAMAGTAVVTMAGTVDMAMVDMAMVVVTMADCTP